MSVTNSVLGNVEIPEAPEVKSTRGTPSSKPPSRYMKNKLEAEKLAEHTKAKRKAKRAEKLPQLSFGLGAGEGLVSTKALKRIRKGSKPGGKLSKKDHKVAVHKAAVKQILSKKQEPEKGGGSLYGACSFCGKPLTKPSSVAQGMGDYCAHNKGALPGGVTREEHIANLTVTELPKDYIPVGKVAKAALEAGYSGSRLKWAQGGSGGIRPPLNEHFKIVFFKGKKYMPASSLKHFKDLEKK